ncbi:hypothetical protein [uncultured Megasphaera sp.]|jgi:hypothetical protein|uniref:hypothetical protein n=1 Tax=uncultured Megasphaera sp. TaxID=165188 RepID=UPI0020569668|nr:hypothetical protein [uncultured Megasphaera sp.]DAQ13035.1 MAG TPA: hypothetical protein [Caudoviricetes sp.]
MGFSVIRNRISITRGDSAQITLTIRDRVTGKLFVPGPDDRLTFTVKRELSDEAPVVVKTLDNGIVRREQECLLLLVPEDTARLPFGTYRYDVELVLASGYTDTVIPPSPFLVTGEVTTHGEI